VPRWVFTIKIDCFAAKYLSCTLHSNLCFFLLSISVVVCQRRVYVHQKALTLQTREKKQIHNIRICLAPPDRITRRNGQKAAASKSFETPASLLRQLLPRNRFYCFAKAVALKRHSVLFRFFVPVHFSACSPKSHRIRGRRSGTGSVRNAIL
jgi:hypothetical protein